MTGEVLREIKLKVTDSYRTAILPYSVWYWLLLGKWMIRCFALCRCNLQNNVGIDFVMRLSVPNAVDVII